MNRAVSAFLLLACSTLCHAEMVVIVHADNGSTLSQAQIAAIYLGKTKTFPGGPRAQPFVVDYASAGLDEFMTAYLGKSVSQYRALWSRLMFSGEAIAPKALASHKEVVESVAGNKDAIGIVEASAVTPQVKVVGKL